MGRPEPDAEGGTLDAASGARESGGHGARQFVATTRQRLERLLLFRVWERMLEVEFVDRSVALAGKAFVSFFPLVIVIAAFVPERLRSSIITTLTTRLGFQGEALQTAKAAFASSDDVRHATGVLGLVLTIFFATSFTTALQRVYLRAWRRPSRGRSGAYWRGAVWLVATLLSMAVLGALASALDSGIGFTLFAVLGFIQTTALWWFTSWLLLLGDVRPRVLLPTALVTSVTFNLFAASANVWMPTTLSKNQAQFGMFGIALALVTWFSGAAICILLGACAGPVLAEDPGPVGSLVRGGADTVLSPGAPPSYAAPTREITLHEVLHGTDPA